MDEEHAHLMRNILSLLSLTDATLFKTLQIADVIVHISCKVDCVDTKEGHFKGVKRHRVDATPVGL